MHRSAAHRQLNIHRHPLLPSQKKTAHKVMLRGSKNRAFGPKDWESERVGPRPPQISGLMPGQRCPLRIAQFARRLAKRHPQQRFTTDAGGRMILDQHQTTRLNAKLHTGQSRYDLDAVGHAGAKRVRQIAQTARWSDRGGRCR